MLDKPRAVWYTFDRLILVFLILFSLKHFLGPITDDMLKRALMVDEDEVSANSKDNKLETTTYTRPVTAPKIVQIKEVDG